MFLLWVSLFSFFSFTCSAHLTLTLCFVLNPVFPLPGGHSRNSSGSSESSLPNLARSLLLVDQLIDL